MVNLALAADSWAADVQATWQSRAGAAVAALGGATTDSTCPSLFLAHVRSSHHPVVGSTIVPRKHLLPLTDSLTVSLLSIRKMNHLFAF